MTVSMDVEPKRAIGQVIQSINQEVLPQLRADFPGITWSFQGSQAEMRESAQALWGGFALAMAVIYALLAVAFGSYTQPLIVMFAFPFGIVGAVIGHILLGYDLSLISLMGVIALSGVVVNDSLIMIDFAILETSRLAYYLIPMAISLGFGIVFATSIILVLLPCLYMILEDVVSLMTGSSEVAA